MAESSWKERYGEWALVTGASAGIGEEFCHQLAMKGMNIVLVARRGDLLTTLGEQLTSDYGVKTREVVADLIQADTADRIEEAVSDLEVGLLVNNAGFGHLGTFHKKSAERDEEMIRLNCLAPVALSHKFLPKMVEREKGGIIFLASKAAYQATPYFSVYSATKVFNLFLGEGMWEEYRGKGIDVMALSPGYTNTDFQKSAGLTEDVTGLLWSTPDKVVATALKSFGKKPSVIHGGLNWFLAFAARFAPRKLNTIVAGIVTRSNP
ncbi:MAG: SDR family oxidoreductase [Candidatus Neomarinimicrobiota bacterium]|nr:SDR family oxidoreductase [Candidatus Neomarinimicrobiota bacterium]